MPYVELWSWMEFFSAKAEEMTIDKTIELCRSNTQNTTVKSVLASGTFSNPKEVIAKYVIETNKTKQEAQIFALQKFERRSGQNRGGHSQNRGGRNNNFNRRNSNNHEQQNGWRGNGQNNQNNGYRRGNFRRGNQNNNGQSNRTFQENTRNVRRVENVQAPQRTMGEANEE